MKKFCLIRLKIWQAIIFLFAMSFLLTMFLFLLQPLPFGDVFEAIRESSGLNLFLNWLPLFFAMLFLYFAGAGATTATTVVGALALALGFANRTKIILRGDPLVPWDLFLGGEVAGILRSFETSAVLAVVCVCVFYIALAVAAAFFIRSEKIDWKIRVGGALGCLILTVAFNSSLYNNVAVTNRLYVGGNVWNQVNQFNSRGFVFSFINAYNTNRVMRPDGYNREIILQKISQADTSGLARLEGAEHPHIIMVMGEAFSELALSPHFDFTGFDDPLENWREIKNDGISGEIIVSVLGGGTAQTEFDVLTGLNSRQFAGVPFAFRMINDDFESIATLLNSLGYRSEFMHPGFAWFYNRQNVYRYLGFERLVFLDEFDDVPTKGWYINEHDTINRTIQMFEEHRENFPDTPYFNFTVTIQNHGPYVDKYLIDGPVEGANFSTPLPLADADINALFNYFHGLRDADIELGRLTNYLNTLNEPVVLIYFGDHMPAFNARVYETVFDDETRTHRVPYLIWFNDAAEGYDVLRGEELFGAPFLGAYVMEILGFENISPFFDFNKQMRRNDDLLEIYRDWSYFRIFDER